MSTNAPSTKNENIILLETINPQDLTVDELWELADTLGSTTPQFEFIPACEEQYGAGVTWHEVIHVWVASRDVIEGAAFQVIFSQIVDSMKERFKKRHRNRRPKSIIVNDQSTGKEIISVQLNAPDSEPVEVDVHVKIRPVPTRQERRHD